jgi:hypothetical protein
MATVRPAVVATLVVVASLLTAFVGDVMYTQWRVDWALKSIRVGDTHSHVLEVLGEPDNGPLMSAGSCSNSGASCESWKLVHENYLTVCYDTAGRVTCREAWEMWY